MKENDSENNRSESIELYADQEGQRHIQQILVAVENEPWGVTLFQLAWTAGPITFIALQGGYLLGYGKTAPFKLFTYFAAYTLITGLIGFIFKTFYKAHKNTQNEWTKNNYLTSNDLLFRLYRKFSDFRLSQLSKVERKAESSSILLSNTHALPASIALGVKELTDNEALIALSKNIELFRRSGLFSRINDLIENSDALKDKDTLQLINTPNEAGYYLKMRLQGNAPTLQEGMARADGFLQRVNQASENNKPSLISLKDAEEFLVLLYELLNGRKITFLTFSYANNKKLRQTARTLEKSIAAFRLSRASLLTKIDNLYSKMINDELITDVKDYNARVKCEQIFNSLNDYATQLLTDLNKQNHLDVINKRDTFSMLVNEYTKISKQYKETITHQKLRKQAVKNWRTLSNQYNNKKTKFRYGTGKKGLRINQKVISLDDVAKLNCSNAIINTLDNYWYSHACTSNLNSDGIKALIIDLSRELDNFINITNPINQYGIESSNATNFGSLDLDSSIEARTLWSAYMVAETKNNLHHAAEQLAKVLLYEYDETLDEKAITFLNQKYGANQSNLLKFIDDKKHSDYKPVHDIPVQIDEEPQEWKLVIKKARKI